MTHWWRAYDDAIDHPKLLKLSDAMHRAWWTLQCVASANGGTLPPTADIAVRLRMKPSKVALWITQLVDAKLIDNQDGVFRPHNWDDRQYQAKAGADDSKGKYVYFIRTASVGALVKVGISKNPWARVGEIQTGHHEKLFISATFKTKETSEVDLHTLLAPFRRQGEWFDLPGHVMEMVLSAHEAKADYASLIILLRSGLRNTTTETVRSNDVAIPRAEAEQKTDSEQSRAEAACAPIDQDLKKKAVALGAGVSAHFVGRQLPIPDLKRCEHWLREGYAQGTILAAIEAVLKRGTKPATLEYFDGAIKDKHAKAAPDNLQIVPPGVFVIEGTLEWSCWDRHLRETTGRGSPVIDNRHPDTGSLRRGFWRPKLVPDGYDEVTGEKLSPASEDAA